MTRGIFLRHVLRDVAASTLAVLAVLLVVLVTYQLAFVLGRAADGQVPGGMVLQLVWLTLRGNLNVILPLGVLLGTVIGLGRLYHDSEVTAALACGVGNGMLHAAAGLVTVAVAVLAAYAALVDAPVAARQVVALRTAALRTAVTRGLTPGEFRDLGQGTTLYFRSMAADGSLQNVFLQRDLPAGARDEARMQIVLAAAAHYSITPDNDFYRIELVDGRSYEGAPGFGDWRTMEFGRQQLQIPAPGVRLPGRPRVDTLPLRELLQVPDPWRVAEWHWRIGWVMAVLVLGVMAVPLARLRPRQGRHARVPWAVLMFAVYAALLSSGRSMLERGDLPLAAGLWWVHAASIALGAAIISGPGLLARWFRAAGPAPSTP